MADNVESLNDEDFKKRVITELQQTVTACEAMETPAEDIRVQLFFSLANLKRIVKLLEEHRVIN